MNSVEMHTFARHYNYKKLKLPFNRISFSILTSFEYTEIGSYCNDMNVLKIKRRAKQFLYGL